MLTHTSGTTTATGITTRTRAFAEPAYPASCLTPIWVYRLRNRLEETMKIGTEDWWKGGDVLSLGTDVLSGPRQVDVFFDFYERWSSQVFAFCVLVCGDEEKAEWLTQETFTLYFRGADSVALRNRSRVPVALLRFAADLAKTHCSQRWGAGSFGLAENLLSLPFKDRAAFILVSILRVQPSAAAVALRLRSSQLAAYWIRSALRLRWFWLRTDRPREAAQSAA